MLFLINQSQQFKGRVRNRLIHQFQTTLIFFFITPKFKNPLFFFIFYGFRHLFSYFFETFFYLALFGFNFDQN